MNHDVMICVIKKEKQIFSYYFNCIISFGPFHHLIDIRMYEGISVCFVIFVSTASWKISRFLGPLTSYISFMICFLPFDLFGTRANHSHLNLSPMPWPPFSRLHFEGVSVLLCLKLLTLFVLVTLAFRHAPIFWSRPSSPPDALLFLFVFLAHKD